MHKHTNLHENMDGLKRPFPTWTSIQSRSQSGQSQQFGVMQKDLIIKLSGRIAPGGAYAAANKNGWYEEATKHMEVLNPKGKWSSKSAIIDDAKKVQFKVCLDESFVWCI